MAKKRKSQRPQPPLESEAPQANIRAKVLIAAENAVNGSCDIAYGSPEDNFARIEQMWNRYMAVRARPIDAPISVSDVAIFNILLKVARLAGNPSHLDSWIDIAGYAACGAEVANRS